MLTWPAKVPIVAYHSIADEHDHIFGYLSLPVSLFERQLEYLHRKGFNTVTLYDVYAYLRGNVPLPPRAIALTFDDGYLDTWVYAFPLLKKYGMKATVFVVTDFVDPLDRLRPTSEDVAAGRIAGQDLAWWGYASWRELQAMQDSGLVDVQSHTQTHTWDFVGDRIVDFHHPADEYFWMDWNLRPEQKYDWLVRDFRASVPWGTPIYQFAGTLLGRRYFDDPDVAREATAYVADRGGAEYFTRQGWREELTQAVDMYRARTAKGLEGRYETDAEYVARVTAELVGSRSIIEQRLNKPVDFLCWPCGDYTPRLQQLAVDKGGYLATVNVQKTANRPGDDPAELRRIVFGQDYAGVWRSDLVFLNFCGNVNYHSGVSLAYPVAPIARRLMKVGRLLQTSRSGAARPS